MSISLNLTLETIDLLHDNLWNTLQYYDNLIDELNVAKNKCFEKCQQDYQDRIFKAMKKRQTVMNAAIELVDITDHVCIEKKLIHYVELRGARMI